MKKQNIVIIAGPGETAFNSKNIYDLRNKLRDESKNIYCIGDGDSKINEEELNEKLNIISENGNSTTFLIHMHGTLDDKKNFKFINGDSYISSKDFFTNLNDKFKDQPIDMFVTSCHSGGCLKDKNVLPNESVIVALSSKENTTAGSDVKNFFKNIKIDNNNLSAYGLLNMYLVSLENRISPEIGVSGDISIINLDNLFKRTIGKKINDTTITSSILNNNMSKEELNRISNKITNSKSEYDILAKEYGKALSICLVNKYGENFYYKKSPLQEREDELSYLEFERKMIDQKLKLLYSIERGE